MDQILGLIKGINFQGAVGVAVAVVLLGLLGWSGCAKRDIRVERDAWKNMYEQEVIVSANWKLNAESWEDASTSCTQGAQAIRDAARRSQEDLLRELRTVRTARQLSELQLQRLREEVERGDLTIHELLRRVQAI